MSFINTKTMLARANDLVSSLLPRFDSLGEFQRRQCTELVVDSRGFKLVPRKSLRSPDGFAGPHASVATAGEACAFLRRGEDVKILVVAEKCLIRDVELPRSADRKLNDILRLDVAHVTPFKADDVYSAGIEVGGSNDSGSISVKHIILRKDLVDDIARQVIQAGAKVVGLGLCVLEHRPAVALTVDGLPFGIVMRRYWTKLFAGTLAAAVLGCLALFYAQSAYFSASKSLVEQATSQFQLAVADVRKALDKRKMVSAEFQTLKQKATNMPSRLAALEEFSRILPDTAFLRSLTVDGDSAIIEGDAMDPERLIKDLESSAMFQDVAFNAPVLRTPGQDTSHFGIKLRLEMVKSLPEGGM
jgi:general secretion pathway protein L